MAKLVTRKLPGPFVHVHEILGSVLLSHEAIQYVSQFCVVLLEFLFIHDVYE